MHVFWVLPMSANEFRSCFCFPCVERFQTALKSLLAPTTNLLHGRNREGGRGGGVQGEGGREGGRCYKNDVQKNSGL